MEMLVFLVSLAVFLPLGIPIAVVLVLSAIVLMLFMGNFDALIVGQTMFTGTNTFVLMAIPFFVLAGEIMTAGGLSKRIVDFANIIMGRLRGGLGYAAIVGSVIFAGLSGSPIADTAALGAILIPLMASNGYRVDRSTGLICAGGIIAAIIPPSIPMIVLGAIVGISISRLFMAGIVPGIIMALALMATWRFIVYKDQYKDIKRYSARESFKIIVDAIPALFMPVIIILGIRFGVFTPTEAGAFAVVYAILISMFWYRELKPSMLLGVVMNAAKSTAVVMFIVAGATVIGWLITVAQIPNQFASIFGGLIDRPLILLLCINVFLLLLGMVMDLTPNLLIFGPVLFPVIEQAGINPYFFGVIMIINLCIGLITPPVGTILYLGCSLGKISFTEVTKGVLPFLAAEAVIVFLYILFPQLVLSPMSWILQ